MNEVVTIVKNFSQRQDKSAVNEAFDKDTFCWKHRKQTRNLNNEKDRNTL